MRASSLSRPATAAAISVLLSNWHLPTVNALTATPVSQPNLDLSALGRVALTGNFDSISIYSYTQETESTPSTNGSQSLLATLPNGDITTLLSADADILTMCPWTRSNGSFEGVVVGGNFTSLGGVQAEGIALYDPTTNTIQNMSGLSGVVQALLCDQESDSVYVGGDFTIDSSTNAMIWNGSTGWQELSFGGFNGPVSSIVQDSNGHIIFGGNFDGLGNVTSTITNSSQVINLSTANVTSDAQSTLSGFTDPQNIICKTSDADTSGNTWLLADYSPGFWKAEMGFTFYPSKVRLYNTHYEGRGTKSFLLQALPDTGIMNLTYTDPATGQSAYCDSSCPLSNDTSEIYRDFELVNPVGMTGFMIQIQDWYGQGAGLDGVEIFQDQIFTYAVNDFNEPSCDGIEFPSASNTTGSWTVTSAGSSTDYLVANASSSSSVSITFEPDIQQSGNYSVLLYTPGCTVAGTCGSRGMVNVTATFSSTEAQASLDTSEISQTNDYEKYDTIYTGYIEASSDDFRSKITVTPLEGQGDIEIVASRVGFDLISSTGGELNGLYDYDPQNATDTDFSSDSIDSIGLQLSSEATVYSLVQSGEVIYAAGNFSDSTLSNIMSFNSSGNATSLSGGGLDSYVQSLLLLNNTLYAGGNFTNTAQGDTQDLNYVAAYSTASNTWSPLGAGVNGPVTSILSFSVNSSDGTTETTVAVSGLFNQIAAFGSNASVDVSGFAIWVPSQQNWLANLDGYEMVYNGLLTATANIGNNTTILAGSLTSDGISSGGVVSLVNSDGLALQPLPVNIQETQNGGSISKRDSTAQNTSEVFVGYYDTTEGRNLTILGGQFTAQATNGSTIQNLLFLNGSDTVTGLPAGVDSNSTFTTLAVYKNTLFAGGSVTGSVGSSTLNGFITYNLSTSGFTSSQPPALTGDNVVTNAITVRPSTSEVYFGGVFDAAGALPCPAVCAWDTSERQWNRPGVNMAGTVTSLQWASDSQLIAAGNLTIDGNQTMIATYDTSSQKWSTVSGASPSEIPGTVTAFGAAATDLSSYWISGQDSNGSTFLMEYDGSNFNSAGQLFDPSTTILGLQVVGLSTDHSSTDLLDNDQILLITGQLVIPDFGNASAAFFNGTKVTPFLLSSTADGGSGTIREMFTENQNTFSGKKSHRLSSGLVVLVSFCIALGCVFLIVALGVIFNRIQRYRQGYVQAPTAFNSDRPTSMRRVPPEYLFDSLRQRNFGAPTL